MIKKQAPTVAVVAAIAAVTLAACGSRLGPAASRSAAPVPSGATTVLSPAKDGGARYPDAEPGNPGSAAAPIHRPDMSARPSGQLLTLAEAQTKIALRIVLPQTLSAPETVVANGDDQQQAEVVAHYTMPAGDYLKIIFRGSPTAAADTADQMISTNGFGHVLVLQKNIRALVMSDEVVTTLIYWVPKEGSVSLVTKTGPKAESRLMAYANEMLSQ